MLKNVPGRRYIVVGGSGFLGGWVVSQLLQRGEDPKRIRILDVRAPTRDDLTHGPAKDVVFVQTDISDRAAVDRAFDMAWPDSAGDSPITVFHTASNIRFFERHRKQLGPSEKVNIGGTKNILDASRRAGVKTLIYTSSGICSSRRICFEDI